MEMAVDYGAIRPRLGHRASGSQQKLVASRRRASPRLQRAFGPAMRVLASDSAVLRASASGVVE
jgi:hypothetical protein